MVHVHSALVSHMRRGHGQKRKSPGWKPGDVEGGEERKVSVPSLCCPVGSSEVQSLPTGLSGFCCHLCYTFLETSVHGYLHTLTCRESTISVRHSVIPPSSFVQGEGCFSAQAGIQHCRRNLYQGLQSQPIWTSPSL